MDPTNSYVSQLDALKKARSLSDLAQILGIKPSSLSYILYKIEDAKKYRVFDIPKKSGGVRKISAPCSKLNAVQRKLSDVLQNCQHEILETRHSKSPSYAFVRGRSIFENAKNHKNKRFVFNIDLKDFFGSINFGRVRGYFLSNSNFSLTPEVATVISQISVFENGLPQGSPCSPVISNLIGEILDFHLKKLAIKNKCTYSRYADDITFSTNLTDFPVSIAIEVESKWKASDELEGIILRCGFEINESKVRMQNRRFRQEVTGLIVNRRVNTKAEYRRQIRAMVHSLYKSGSFYLPSGEIGTLNQLHGMLGFAHHIDDCYFTRSYGNDGVKMLADKSITKSYKKFLVYKDIFSSEKPLLLVEGKTDIIYLEQAVRGLKEKLPGLVKVSPDDESRIAFRILRYPENSSGNLLGLTGGTSKLSNFLHYYKDQISALTTKSKLQPLIFIIDSDTGSKALIKAAKEILGKGSSVPESGYFKVFRNVYFLFIPVAGGAIEECFNEETRKIDIGGRSFSSTDSSKRLSKIAFATKVVKAGGGAINFDGFLPIFNIIEEIIAENERIFPES